MLLSESWDKNKDLLENGEKNNRKTEGKSTSKLLLVFFFVFILVPFFLFIFKSLRSFSFLQRKKQLDLKVCFFFHFYEILYEVVFMLCSTSTFIQILSLFFCAILLYVFFLPCSLEYVGDNEFNKIKEEKLLEKE